MEHSVHHTSSKKSAHYGRLLLMIVLSFISMYIFMYAMVNRLENVYPNFNQFYMAGLMTAPMLILELVLMGSMYQNKRLNGLLIAIGIGAGLLFWVLIRQQTAIDDRQFLKSMIPHHAGAILMCEESPSRNPEILRLCREIVASQRAEIAEMKGLLRTGEASPTTQ
jgi:hypothetical protein